MMLLEGVAVWRTQEAACGRGFDSGSARHIHGIQSQNMEVAGKEIVGSFIVLQAWL